MLKISPIANVDLPYLIMKFATIRYMHFVLAGSYCGSSLAPFLPSAYIFMRVKLMEVARRRISVFVEIAAVFAVIFSLNSSCFFAIWFVLR